MTILCTNKACLWEKDGVCIRECVLRLNNQGKCISFHSYQGQEKEEYYKEREENGSEEHNSEMCSEPNVSV